MILSPSSVSLAFSKRFLFSAIAPILTIINFNGATVISVNDDFSTVAPVLVSIDSSAVLNLNHERPVLRYQVALVSDK